MSDSNRLKVKKGSVHYYEGSVTVNGRDGEMWRYVGAKNASEKDLKRLVRRVRRAGSINPHYWKHYRTIYGSKAYQRNGVEQQVRNNERYGASRDMWKAM